MIIGLTIFSLNFILRRPRTQTCQCMRSILMVYMIVFASSFTVNVAIMKLTLNITCTTVAAINYPSNRADEKFDIAVSVVY